MAGLPPMELNEFFEPYSHPPRPGFPHESAMDLKHRFLAGAAADTAVELAILGIPEDRGSRGNQGCSLGADAIREELYCLQDHLDFGITDLGNLRPGHSLQDTRKALEMTLVELEARKIFPIILGGSQDLTYAQFAALGEKNLKVDLLSIDSHFDLQEDDTENRPCDSENWLRNVLGHEPDILFNYSHLGYQTCFTNQPMLRLMEQLCFDTYRLGELSGNMQDTEPVIRSAHMISFDIAAVRYSDAPGRAFQSPHGLYGEEACQIMRYAGMNSQLSSLGLYEYNPRFDRGHQTAQLLAQMIWYFMDGYMLRKKEIPFSDTKNFVKYRTLVNSGSTEILFYKSVKTSRWWMQVPFPERYARNGHYHLVPCLYEDYQHASQGEMPDRWWRTYQKL